MSIRKFAFVGGTYAVSSYCILNGIQRHMVIHNVHGLMSIHNSIPVVVMEDAHDVYGSDLRDIINYAKENEYEVVFLNYQDDFPMDTEQNVPTQEDLVRSLTQVQE